MGIPIMPKLRKNYKSSEILVFRLSPVIAPSSSEVHILALLPTTSH